MSKLVMNFNLFKANMIFLGSFSRLKQVKIYFRISQSAYFWQRLKYSSNKRIIPLFCFSLIKSKWLNSQKGASTSQVDLFETHLPREIKSGDQKATREYFVIDFIQSRSYSHIREFNTVMSTSAKLTVFQSIW